MLAALAWRRRRPCGNCANRCPKRSAATAPASSTTSRCRSRPSRRSSSDGAALARRLAARGRRRLLRPRRRRQSAFQCEPEAGTPTQELPGARTRARTAMFDLVESLGGSISAEHGIGRLKAAEFARRADPVELAVMHALKTRARPEGHHESRQGAVRTLTLPLSAPPASICASSSEPTSAPSTPIPSDPRVTRYLFFGPRDEDSTAEYLEGLLASQRERPRTRFELAVEEIASGARDRRLRLVVHRTQCGRLGIHAGHDDWGKGYATEIALALVDAAFFDLRADRVISTVDVNNRASIRVLEKIGMRWEAVFRKHRRAKNRWWDCHLFVLPREVWEASRHVSYALDARCRRPRERIARRSDTSSSDRLRRSASRPLPRACSLARFSTLLARHACAAAVAQGQQSADQAATTSTMIMTTPCNIGAALLALRTSLASNLPARRSPPAVRRAQIRCRA